MRDVSNQHGFVLIVSLIFTLLLSFLVISDASNLIATVQSQSLQKKYQELYYNALRAMRDVELYYLQKQAMLPVSTQVLQILDSQIGYDECGNKTIIITVIAKNSRQRLVLQSKEIFARVPRLKDCKEIPRQQILWWRENPDEKE